MITHPHICLWSPILTLPTLIALLGLLPLLSSFHCIWIWYWSWSHSILHGESLACVFGFTYIPKPPKHYWLHVSRLIFGFVSSHTVQFNFLLDSWCWVYVFGLVFPHTSWPFHWPPGLTFLEQTPNMQIDLHQHSHFGANHRHRIHHHRDHWCWVHDRPSQSEGRIRIVRKQICVLSELWCSVQNQNVFLQKFQGNLTIITLSLSEETIMKEANLLYQHEREGWHAQEPNLCKLICAITHSLY